MLSFSFEIKYIFTKLIDEFLLIYLFLEHRLYKRYETIYEEGEEAVQSWIEEQQVTRAEAEQIADVNGTFLHQRLSTLLDRDINEKVAIFVDDKLEDDKQ